MMNILGVMQGRLLPKFRSQYQAHPKGYWKSEFFKAKKFELDCIEFIADTYAIDENPLMTEDGCKAIREISLETGVNVTSICADCFMTDPLHIDDNKRRENAVFILKSLIKGLASLKGTDIVVPCVDQSAIRNRADKDRLALSISECIPLAEQLGVNICLETDLKPREFRDFVELFKSKNVTINYDTGNSAALGFEPAEEFNEYGHLISNIHIKDRVLSGGPVLLNTGCVDFDKVISLIKSSGFSGPLIMQAYRDDEGLEVFDKQLSWIKPKLETAGLIKIV